MEECEHARTHHPRADTAYRPRRGAYTTTEQPATTVAPSSVLGAVVPGSSGSSGPVGMAAEGDALAAKWAEIQDRSTRPSE